MAAPWRFLIDENLHPPIVDDLKRTRVPVEVVLGSLAGGMEVDGVCDEYGLERADVYAAIEYARASVAGEEIRSLES